MRSRSSPIRSASSREPLGEDRPGAVQRGRRRRRRPCRRRRTRRRPRAARRDGSPSSPSASGSSPASRAICALVRRLGLNGQVDVLQPRLGLGGRGSAPPAPRRACPASRTDSRIAVAPLLQLPQIAQPLLERAQLRVVEHLGRFLAVARDERHGRAAVEQLDGGLHLPLPYAELLGDPAFDGPESSRWSQWMPSRCPVPPVQAVLEPCIVRGSAAGTVAAPRPGGAARRSRPAGGRKGRRVAIAPAPGAHARTAHSRRPGRPGAPRTARRVGHLPNSIRRERPARPWRRVVKPRRQLGQPGHALRRPGARTGPGPAGPSAPPAPCAAATPASVSSPSASSSPRSRSRSCAASSPPASSRGCAGPTSGPCPCRSRCG